MSSRPILQPSSRLRGSGNVSGSARNNQRESTGVEPSTMATVESKEQTLEERQRAYQAAMMLEHNELLTWHAMERNEVCEKRK
jgi:hypothetical protein